MRTNARPSCVARATITGALVLALAACAEAPTDGPAGGRLADLQVTDPDFTFATSRSVRLELRVPAGAAPQLVEVADAEGRRLMQGAFLEGARVALQVPVGQAGALRVRTGRGAQVTEHEVAIDDGGHAVASIR